MRCQGNVVKCQLANRLNVFSSQLKKPHQLFMLPSCKCHYFCSVVSLFLLRSYSFFPLMCYSYPAPTKPINSGC